VWWCGWGVGGGGGVPMEKLKKSETNF